MNWKQRLEKAIEEPPDYDDRMEMEDDANSWRCCMIGERLNLSEIPEEDYKTYSIGWKVSDKIRNIGWDFTDYVNQHDYAGALKLLEETDKTIPKSEFKKMRKTILAECRRENNVHAGKIRQ